MTRGSILLLLAVIWTATSVGTVLLLRHAARVAKRELEAERTRAYRLQCCVNGHHRETLDTEVDHLPKLAWRCIDCRQCVVLGVAYATGTNRRSRRAKHG